MTIMAKINAVLRSLFIAATNSVATTRSTPLVDCDRNGPGRSSGFEGWEGPNDPPEHVIEACNFYMDAGESPSTLEHDAFVLTQLWEIRDRKLRDLSQYSRDEEKRAGLLKGRYEVLKGQCNGIKQAIRLVEWAYDLDDIISPLNLAIEQERFNFEDAHKFVVNSGEHSAEELRAAFVDMDLAMGHIAGLQLALNLIRFTIDASR